MTRTPVISLGAGVQSSALLLLAVRGELPVQPELAIFADTGHEPAGVYEHLEYLEHEAAGRVEIVRVQQLDLRDAALNSSFNPIPLYTVGGGLGQRQCTYQAKIRPLRAELRRRGYGPDWPVACLMGITTDEVARMKPSGRHWIENTWPLIELGMSRHDCRTWAAEHGYRPAPRSACVFCPYRTNDEWRAMRADDPESWRQAVEFDALAIERRGEYVHRSRRPLSDVDLEAPAPQLALAGMDECEGGCFL